MKNLTKKYPFFNEFRYFKLYKVFKFRITKKDNDEILEIIKRYYAFEEIKTTNKSKIGNTKRQTIINSKSKENREKVLT